MAATADVLEECARQAEQYGEINKTLPDGTGPSVAWMYPLTAHPAVVLEQELRGSYEEADAEGRLTWMHLVREEFAESMQESDPVRLRAELKQQAALCISWMAAIDDREA